MKNWIDNLGIRKKLLFCSLVVAGMAIIVGVIGIVAVENMAATGDVSGSRTYILVMIIALALGIAFAGLVVFYISGTIYKPMQKFAVMSQMIAVGDIEIHKVMDEADQKLKDRKDEIGILAGSFGDVIENTIQQVGEVKRIAGGDLTVAVNVKSEKDVMGKALSDLVNKLQGLVSNIVSSADQVNSGAKMVADSSTALSQGAEEQASSIEELTASLEEITTQTTHNAENAEQADVLAQNAKRNADTGNSQMQDMLKAMDDINVSSKNINSIIKVIEDIAFQTNILALNAAVEAARAGQYGKGFAVVAEEVRNLAARSSKAASETTNLIEGSISKVDAGTKIAQATAKALNEIVIDVEKTANLVNEIAQASNQQAAAIDQVNQGIMQISHVVQTNAATSEEGAAASEELSAQSSQLSEFVKLFKLDNSGTGMGTAEKRMSRPDNSRLLDDIIDLGAKPHRGSIAVSDNEFGKY